MPPGGERVLQPKREFRERCRRTGIIVVALLTVTPECRAPVDHDFQITGRQGDRVLSRRGSDGRDATIHALVARELVALSHNDAPCDECARLEPDPNAGGARAEQ